MENAIRKLLSHPLAEVREIGEQVKRTALSEVPTLVKYADAVPYLVETNQELRQAEHAEKIREISMDSVRSVMKNNWCTLIDYDHNGEKKVLAAALYRIGEMPYADALDYVLMLKEAELAQLAESLLKRLGKFDAPLRELEYTTYTFDLVMDQGAYAEFKRHRMMTQTPQLLTTRLGYEIPRLITESGFGSKYEAAMKSAEEMFEKLYAFNPYVAQYVVPNGFNRRVLAQFNLREAFAFCQLRSAANAHYSIRRVAQKIYEEMKRVHPILTKFIKVLDETWQSVDEKYFGKV